MHTANDLYSQNFETIQNWVIDKGEKSFRAKQIWDHLYIQRKNIDEITTLNAELKEQFINEFPNALAVERTQISRDKTNKWLFKLRDGYFIESVLMKYDKRNTLCISSQAGCAMACSFCATGQAGFDRHLTSGEIIEQVMLATNLSKSKISNIVFMGMGEPLANTKNVYEACSKLVNDMNLSARHITVSTVGIVPGMNEMAKWDLPLTLAVSLHSPFNDKRSEIIPINKRYPIQQVLDAACVVSKAHNRRVSFEYTAIENVNIDNNHAHSLGKLLSEYEGVGGAHLNIIPLNTTSKFSGKTASNDQIKKFSETVAHHGISVSIRKNRGNDIDAACGQLRERHENAN